MKNNHKYNTDVISYQHGIWTLRDFILITFQDYRKIIILIFTLEAEQMDIHPLFQQTTVVHIFSFLNQKDYLKSSIDFTNTNYV